MLKILPKDRLAIFFFYDAQGIADPYVIDLIKGLNTIAGRLLVVVNGELTPQSAEEIAPLADEIFCRPNVGFDAWAYKDAFEHIGWDELRKYKEVVYCNATVYGPVFPFSEMFDRMAEKEDLDFWGITFHPDLMTKDTLNPLGYIPEHIQHYFVVYRQKFTAAPELKDYWDHLPPIRNYAETVGLHETVFTKHFADMGFKWDTYIRYDQAVESTNYILMFEPLKAITKYRSPVIKRKIFFLDPRFTLINSMGERIPALLDYLRDNKLYDTGIIYRNIIRTSNQADFIDALNFRCIVPENARLTKKPEADYGARTALITLQDSSEESRARAEEAAAHMPRGAEIIPLTNVPDNTEEFFQQLKKAAREREFVCVCNCAVVAERRHSTSGKSLATSQIRALLATRKTVCNIIDSFDAQPFYGLLVPMYPLTLEFGAHWHDRWQGTYQEVRALTEALDISVPFCEEKYPAVPYFSCFWMRSAALLPLLSDESALSRLVGEPISVLRRIYPLAVQRFGYSPGYVTTDQLAGHQFSALFYYAENLSRINVSLDSLVKKIAAEQGIEI
ncbi:MAG: hypothetical protein IJT62_01860 [Oscillospiraceae bacterium]|nr:hypothetical protein [Oscillospiraceae bacterium]